MSGRGFFTDSTTVLQLPDVIMRSDALRALRVTESLFALVFGESGSLERDLEQCARYFDPVAQGQRLRRELQEVNAGDADAARLPDSWRMQIPGGRFLLTPEGVAGMHALRSASTNQQGDALLLQDDAARVSEALLRQYRVWARHRLDGVVRLLEGEDKPLQFQGVGLLLALLINDNVGESRALTRVVASDSPKRSSIDSVFDQAVAAFVRVLSPASQKKSGRGELISGWFLGEIARRLGSDLVAERGGTQGPGRVFIKEGGVTNALKLIARDLARGNRSIPTPETLVQAFDELVTELRLQRGVLASFGELHEDPSKTRDLRVALDRAYRLAVGPG